MTQPNPCASWKRSLAIVWIGEFFSVLTSSILQMGLIWHVTLTTGSASALSFVSLAAFLPMRSSAPSRAPSWTARPSSVS